MKNALPFISPVANTTQKPVRRELYDQSITLYESGKYVEALHSLLDYLNSDIRAKYGNEQGTVFHIPHGSIVVDMTITQDTLSIEADFLNLPQKGRVAMLHVGPKPSPQDIWRATEHLLHRRPL